MDRCPTGLRSHWFPGGGYREARMAVRFSMIVTQGRMGWPPGKAPFETTQFGGTIKLTYICGESAREAWSIVKTPKP
jgi:hypothetical protein